MSDSIRWTDGVTPPSMWSRPVSNEAQTTNERMMEAIRHKQEELFAAWLVEKGLTDFRRMPYSEQRTEMKRRTLAALYGSETQ